MMIDYIKQENNTIRYKIADALTKHGYRLGALLDWRTQLLVKAWTILDQIDQEINK